MVKLRPLLVAQLTATVLTLVAGTAYAAQTATNYSIPLDVLDAGGSDVSKSNNYLLSDSVGEPIVGYGSTSNYILNSGYRQPSASDYISVSCSNTVNLGSVPGTGQKTGSGTCMVYTDAYSGYRLIWHAGTDNQNGLVAHWKLDETSAGTFYDATGNGHDGTGAGATGTNNTPQPATSVGNPFASTRSVSFDGTDDKISMSDANFPSGATSRTVAFWAKVSSFSSSQALFTYGTEFGGKRFEIGTRNGGWLVFAVNGGAYGTQSVPSANTWFHVAVVTGPTVGTSQMYINGVLMPMSLQAGTNVAVNTVLTGTAQMGADVGGASGFLTGSLDDVRMYDRALSAEAIRDLATLAPPGSMTASGSQTSYIPGIFFPFTGGLVGHWKMDEPVAGSTVADSSGYNHDLTPNGAAGGNNLPQPDTGIPVESNAMSFRSLDFDGTDDYVRVASYSGFPTSTFTACTWVNTLGNGGADQYLWSQNRNGSNIANEGIFLIDGATGKLIFWDYNGTSYGYAATGSSNTAVTDGAWHHVCFVKNGTSGTYYLDGASDGTKTAALNVTYGTNDFIVGGNVRDNNKYFSGQMDDFRIYSTVLSAAQIKALAGKPQTWSVAATDAAWAGRLSSRSTDTDSKWGTDGSSDAWLNIGEGSYPLVRRYTPTPLTGSEEIFQFRAEVGSSKVQPAGTYTGNLSFTVVGY